MFYNLVYKISNKLKMDIKINTIKELKEEINKYKVDGWNAYGGDIETFCKKWNAEPLRWITYASDKVLSHQKINFMGVLNVNGKNCRGAKLVRLDEIKKLNNNTESPFNGLLLQFGKDADRILKTQKINTNVVDKMSSKEVNVVDKIVNNVYKPKKIEGYEAYGKAEKVETVSSRIKASKLKN